MNEKRIHVLCKRLKHTGLGNLSGIMLTLKEGKLSLGEAKETGGGPANEVP